MTKRSGSDPTARNWKWTPTGIVNAVPGPTSTVALAWRREHTTPDVETFVGIVRGRTANSSR